MVRLKGAGQKKYRAQDLVTTSLKTLKLENHSPASFSAGMLQGLEQD
jgi:hypothetical protein